MTTTAAALALSQAHERAHLLVGSISSMFTECDDHQGVDAHARAKILATIGRVDALHLARSQDEFEAACEMLATRRSFFEFARLVSDEHVQRLIRAVHACEIAGHHPPVKSTRAAELRDDLGERFSLLMALLSKMQPQTKPPTAVLEALAAVFVAGAGLQLAAYSTDRWAEWMTGMLWNSGRRALIEIAREAGISWETAVDTLTTRRDRSLLAQPFDQAMSDEAARLLGIQ